MRCFDLFSGYGGFTIACENNGIETIGFSEIDKYASMVLKYHWPKVKNYGDIRKIKWGGIPDFDLLTFGSPCQSFSIAGKRKGLAGASGLVWEAIRCLAEKNPEYFIFENVKGALSSRRGFDFASILVAFSEQGYDLWWQVLNAKDFGVPQSRERIFVVGSRKKRPGEIFFERESNGIFNKAGGREQEEGQGLWCEDIVSTIDTRYGALRNSGETYIKQLNKVDTGNTNAIENGTRIRRLSPTECSRLMGLPDNWLKWGINDKGEKVEISDSQKYKMAGNGIVVNVVDFLMGKMILK